MNPHSVDKHIHVQCSQFTCVLGYNSRSLKKYAFHIYPKYNPRFPTEAHSSLVSLLGQILVRASLISLVPRDDIFSHLFGG